MEGVFLKKRSEVNHLFHAAKKIVWMHPSDHTHFEGICIFSKGSNGSQRRDILTGSLWK